MICKFTVSKTKGIQAGQIYMVDDLFGNNPYIVAQVGPKECCLLSLTVGNRYSEPVKVRDVLNISFIEFAKMLCDTDEYECLKVVSKLIGSVEKFELLKENKKRIVEMIKKKYLPEQEGK